MATLTIDALKTRWNEVLDQLLAQDRIVWLAFFDARLVSLNQNILTINFSDSQKFGGDHDFSITRNPRHIGMLQEVIERTFGEKLVIQEK
jgi:hypothetical protein